MHLVPSGLSLIQGGFNSPMLCIVQTSTERSEVGANTPLLRSRRQMPLWHLSACTGEVYCDGSHLLFVRISILDREGF